MRGVEQVQLSGRAYPPCSDYIDENTDLELPSARGPNGGRQCGGGGGGGGAVHRWRRGRPAAPGERCRPPGSAVERLKLKRAPWLLCTTVPEDAPQQVIDLKNSKDHSC